MHSKNQNKFLTSAMWIAVGVLFTVLALVPRVTPAASLSELVAKAKQEGALNATATSSMKPVTASKLAAAFKKRFGLNIKVTITPLSDTRNYPKYAAETKAGVAATYDAVDGSGKNNVQLVALGGVEKIDGWKALLAEINPLVGSGKVRPLQISPDPFSGFAFQYLSRLKSIIYNPNLISKKDLPKTHADLVDPKYKGRWTQPPFAAHWDVGPLVFPDISQEEWIEIVTKAGKNAGAVQQESAGIQRVLIGEFAFAPANSYYFLRIKAKDSQAPIEITYFKDYNPVTGSYYVVRKGAPHPAAGTLFALWMGTPGAKAVWQPDLFSTQFEWGDGELERKIRQYLKESDAKTISFFDSERGVEFLRWIGTPEGRKYRKAVSKAIRGKKWKRKKREKR